MELADDVCIGSHKAAKKEDERECLSKYILRKLVSMALNLKSGAFARVTLH